PSYSNSTQPFSTYTNCSLQSCRCHSPCGALPGRARITCATTLPRVARSMPRSRYSKYARSPRCTNLDFDLWLTAKGDFFMYLRPNCTAVPFQFRIAAPMSDLFIGVKPVEER